MSCYLCGKPHDLRPYGPKGEMVCYTCAFSTPERKAQTEKSFSSQIAACGDSPVVIGESVGPYPLRIRQGGNV
jgi:hypothetical protein